MQIGLAAILGVAGHQLVASEIGRHIEMQPSQFWSLIDLIEGSRNSDDTTNLVPLVDALSGLPPGDIEAFFEALAQHLFALDTRAHYRAFSWFSGLSDTFLYTRLAVVAQGQEYYETVLSNPSTFPSRSVNWLEGLLYAADEAYELATGQSFSRHSSVSVESFSNEKGWAR